MKPGSIARRGYTKDSIRLARRFLRFCTVLRAPPEANDAGTATQGNRPP
jgi:hypothetical protein